MRWIDLIDDKVSAAHASQVMSAATVELKKRVTPRRAFIWGGASLGLAALTATFIAVFSRKILEKPSTDVGPLAHLAENDFTGKDFEDLDLVADLDLLEDLEVLEKWEPS